VATVMEVATVIAWLSLVQNRGDCAVLGKGGWRNPLENIFRGD
jgi:hypothetical protein